MDSYHLSISKIEGLQDVSDSYLYIYSGPNILRVLTLDNFESTPVPINKGTFRMVIEDSQTSTPQASISFKSDIFTKYGYHWLPLYTGTEKILEKLPEEVSLPRVLVDVQSSFLAPVQETSEESETFEEISETSLNEDPQLLKAKNIGMNIRILELEDMLNRQKKSFDEEIENINKEFLEISEGYQKSFQENKEKDMIIKQLENLLRSKDEKIKDLSHELDLIGGKVKDLADREESILSALRIKDFEIFQLKSKKPLSVEIGDGVGVRRSEKEFVAETSYLEIFQNISSTINLNSKHLVSGYFNSNLSDSLSKSIQEDLEITKKKLFDAEVKIGKYKLKNLENLNNNIKKFLCFHKLQNYASLSTELVYCFGNTKLNIFSKDNTLFYRSSTSIKKLEFFLKSNYQDIQTHRNKNSSQARLKTISEIDKVSKAFQKSFDFCRPKSSNRMHHHSATPEKQLSASPNRKVNLL